MHTVELLKRALTAAKLAGYHIRQEWLDGCAGGGCQINGQKWLFLDLTLNTQEQLDQVIEALRDDPQVDISGLPLELSKRLTSDKAV